MNLGEMNWQEVENYLRKKDIVIIPLGSIEQHGPCLPLITDTRIASSIAEEVGKRTNTITSPCLRPGLSLVPHMAFAGTISLEPNTFADVIEQTIKCLYNHGFRGFLFVNAHDLNDSSLGSAVQVCARDLSEFRFRVGNWWELKNVKEVIEKHYPGHVVGHAEEVEASLILHLDEKLVKIKSVVHDKFPPTFISLSKVKKELTDTGVISGDLSKAKKDVGKEIFKIAVEEYVNMIKSLEKNSTRGKSKEFSAQK